VRFFTAIPAASRDHTGHATPVSNTVGLDNTRSRWLGLRINVHYVRVIYDCSRVSQIFSLAVTREPESALANLAGLGYHPRMKRLALFCFGFLALVFVPVVAQDAKTNAPARIPAAQAKQHVNAEATVFGKVVEIYKTDRLIRMNLDQPFPNQPFTAVIFANKTNLFPEIDKLKDQTVEISGKITEYRSQPQIVLMTTNQLKVLVVKPESGKEKD
jgi:hypothetical protein